MVSSRYIFDTFFSFQLIFQSSLCRLIIFIVCAVKYMGSNTVCRPCCGTDNAGTRHLQLRQKYKTDLKDSQYRSVCIRILDSTFQEDMQLEGEQFLRKSIAVPNNHYETNSLVNSMISQDTIGWGRNSRKTSADSQEEHPSNAISGPLYIDKKEINKQNHMLNLMKQSYLFVDLSECMEESQSSAHYQCMLKQQLLKDQSSLCQSFVTETTKIEQMEWALKLNDTEIMCQLENYVRFCRKVKHDFAPQNDRFLGKLSTQLQAHIIGRHNKRMANNQQLLNQMKNDIDEALKVLGMTVQTLYSIKIPKQVQANADAPVEFCNEINIYSMMTSLFFEKDSFITFVLQKIRQCFYEKFNKYRNQNQYSSSDFIDDLINLTSEKPKSYVQPRSRVEALFVPRANKYSQISLFPQSRKILSKISYKSDPLYKLNIVYQFQKKKNKQLCQLKHQLQTQYNISLSSVFTRQTDLLIAKWILNQNKSTIDQLAPDLIFAYLFIHQQYKIDKKGSCLTTFIQEVERIVQWVQ